MSFYHEIKDSEWECKDVNCIEFAKEANEIASTRDTIASSDLETIRKMFTMIKEWDHFGFSSYELEIESKRMVNYGVLALVSRSCFLLSAMFQRCWGCVASQWLGSNDSTLALWAS
ncbi:hypothetical protein KOR42_52990 [Thalassoglobus neptunius]|uniref:Uncharacterized protein n=1 Tax=Thalassoglobus neptunius TaxID=1938619 RepID=A0A5C5VBF7_9PLAN|nr:hypothetical protein KOR42_52990 [Thalassoglobus neptunius]